MGDMIQKLSGPLGMAGGAAAGTAFGAPLQGAELGGALGGSLGTAFAPGAPAPTPPPATPPAINRASLGSLPPPNISPVAAAGGGNASFADLLKLITSMKSG
jgi:hypothetical protein